MLRALSHAGFPAGATPGGAFYVFADGSEFDGRSDRLARRLLEEGGVATTPGLDFGATGACKTHLRFAFTRPVGEIEAAGEQMRRVLRRMQ
jgi:aspartate/methionine/tyrosine aminotransferase